MFDHFLLDIGIRDLGSSDEHTEDLESTINLIANVDIISLDEHTVVNRVVFLINIALVDCIGSSGIEV